MTVLQGPGVVLLSRDSATRGQLIRELDGLRDQFENLRINGVDPSALPNDLETNAQVVVIDVAVGTHIDEVSITSLRALGFNGPVLVLGQKELKSPASSLRVLDRVIFLSKPYDSKAMLGLVRRMILAPIIAARKYPRHTTNETAEVQVDGKGPYHSCRVKNMSKGGAYLDFDRSLHVRIGDLVILKIKLGTLNREYLLKARVAWLNRGAGFGIEFVASLGR